MTKKTVVKYGSKMPAAVVSGEQRRKFEYDNTVVITNLSCSKENASYKNAIKIEQANLIQSMLDNHMEAVQVLKEDPYMCTSHTIIIINQSTSMKMGDIECHPLLIRGIIWNISIGLHLQTVVSHGQQFCQ